MMKNAIDMAKSMNLFNQPCQFNSIIVTQEIGMVRPFVISFPFTAKGRLDAARIIILSNHPVNYFYM